MIHRVLGTRMYAHQSKPRGPSRATGHSLPWGTIQATAYHRFKKAREGGIAPTEKSSSTGILAGGATFRHAARGAASSCPRPLGTCWPGPNPMTPRGRSGSLRGTQSPQSGGNEATSGGMGKSNCELDERVDETEGHLYRCHPRGLLHSLSQPLNTRSPSLLAGKRWLRLGPDSGGKVEREGPRNLGRGTRETDGQRSVEEESD